MEQLVLGPAYHPPAVGSACSFPEDLVFSLEIPVASEEVGLREGCWEGRLARPQTQSGFGLSGEGVPFPGL